MRMVLISSFSLILSGKWPQAVRANGHLLLNSEKVWKYQCHFTHFVKNLSLEQECSSTNWHCDVAQTDLLCLRGRDFDVNIVFFCVFTRCPNQREISWLSLKPSTSSQLMVHAASVFLLSLRLYHLFYSRLCWNRSESQCRRDMSPSRLLICMPLCFNASKVLIMDGCLRFFFLWKWSG